MNFVTKQDRSRKFSRSNSWTLCLLHQPWIPGGEWGVHVMLWKSSEN